MNDCVARVRRSRTRGRCWLKPLLAPGAAYGLTRATILAFCLCVFPALAQIDDEDPEVLESRLEALRAEIVDIQRRLEDDRAERDEAMDTLAAAERELGRLGRELRETEARIQATHERLAEQRREEQRLEVMLSDEQAMLGEQLRAAYRIGNHSRLRMILSQDKPEHLARALTYHAYLSQARVDIMERLNRQLEALVEVKYAIQTQLDALDRLLETQNDMLRQQEDARDQRALAVAAIEARITDRQVQISQMEDDAEELERLIERLSDVLADIPPDVAITPFAQLRGSLPMPAAGQVRARFGASRGNDVTWNGWLIAAEHDSDVKAVAHGRVIFSDWLRGYGLVMILDHGDGYMSLYAHNESLLFDVGDWIRTGQTIATAGASGGERDTGVYFELRSNGKAIDPAPWISRQ